MAVTLPGRRSLSFRLFVLATVWSLVALAAAAVYLLDNYRRGAERGHAAFINVHLMNVIASIAQDEQGNLTGSPDLADPRFLSLYSGWYWQVVNLGDPADALLSPSLGGTPLTLPPSLESPYDDDFRRSMLIDGPNGATLRAIERVVVLGTDGDAYSFVAAADLSLPRELTARFATQLLSVFAILGIGLVAITVIQVRIGLRPLRNVGRNLAAIREGRAERLEGDYPEEVAPLTREINALIGSNAKIVERARMHVGNLAHALKTPLSVITNEARGAKGPLAEKVTEQAAIMRDQVDWHLDRARMAARVSVVGVVTEVKPVADALERAMARIHSDRGIDVVNAVPAGLKFQGERQDLEEMLGNLIDNAFKWARSRVAIACRRLPGEPARLEIVVDDDGPGLEEEEHAVAMRRGQRLDESKPGSGLGLSIVGELADLYEGDFELDAAPGGGLRARIILPST